MSAVIKNSVLIVSQTKSQLLTKLDQRITFELAKLLKEAQPNREKIHCLAKLMEREISDQDFETIRNKVLSYFRVQYERRTEGQFLQIFGTRPYPWLHNQFMLNFNSASVSETNIYGLASVIKHLFVTQMAPPKELVQTDFLHLTLYKLLHPHPENKKSGFGLSDFIECWNRTAQSKWGEKYNAYFRTLANDVVEEDHGPATKPPTSMGTFAGDPTNEFELSQTDLDWMKSVLTALDQKLELPKYPLSRGPTKPVTRQLEKVVRAHSRIQAGPKAQLLEHAARNLCVTHLKAYSQISLQVGD